MSWSIRLGSVSGIAIRVHFTFALLLAALAYHLLPEQGVRGALFGVLVVTLLFGCVLLHELGHGLVAQRLGVPVREIVLLPIGGAARLLSEPKTPLQELLIALAGPLVNVLLAVIAGLVLWQGAPLPPYDQALHSALLTPSARGTLVLLFYGNVALAVLNMVPALPMDGGRVLRALLSFALGPTRATNVAAALAQALAIALVFYGLQSDGDRPFILIGFLMFFGAGQERISARTHLLLGDLRAGEVCDPHAVTFAPGDSVGAAVDQSLRSAQPHFLVLHGEQPLGTLSRDELVAVAGRVGLHSPIAALMRRDIQSVPADMPLNELRRVLQENGGAAVLVRGDEAVLGVLGPEDLARIAQLSDVLARGGVRRHVAPDAETST